MLLPDSNVNVAIPSTGGMHRSVAADRVGFGGLAEVRAGGRASSDQPPFQAGARRALNVIVALLLLILTMPLMIVVGFLIKLTSQGPILYTQARVGVDRRNDANDVPDGRRVVDYGGRLFRIYKFRTMHVRPEGGPQLWATQDDPRVTVVGRVLRRYRLDELPQLFNVLIGDMNLVGPRPEQPRIFAMLRDQIPNYEARQRVLPGITGLAQVSQAYDTSTEDVRRKIRYDLEYIQRQSTMQDVMILARTLPAVVWKRHGW
jgi:lipopolysaccharide/colanic/teichoic acid biosynthesis glycosyltransferase